MSTPNEQYRQLMQQSQDAVLSAVDTWTKSVQENVGQLSSAPAQVDPTQVVDQVFDFAEKMLEMQRDFAKNLLQGQAALADTLQQQASQGTQTPGS